MVAFQLGPMNPCRAFLPIEKPMVLTRPVCLYWLVV